MTAGLGPALRLLVCGESQRGDDGAAHAVLGLLSDQAHWADIEIRTCAQLDVDDLRGAAAVVVIDAVRGVPPGEIVRCELDELTDHLSLASGSTHTLSLRETLALAAVLHGDAPRGTFVGIGGHRFGIGDELSIEVADALPLFAKAIEQAVADAMAEVAVEVAAAPPSRISALRRSRPRLSDTHITAAHGAGGRASAALFDAVFLEHYGNDVLRDRQDSAILAVGAGAGAGTGAGAGAGAVGAAGSAGNLAFTTDSFVVTPRRFPGGSIGRLAVCGTANDLAVAGARPRWMSIAFVLEEGVAIDEVRATCTDVAQAAAEAGVEIVTGDTKVVGRGAADGFYVTTAGIGDVIHGGLCAGAVRVGDHVLVSGTLGDHGVAVMLARGDLAIEADVESDCAPLWGLVDVLCEAVPSVRWMRDATRGGVATVCCELAIATGCGIELVEAALPVRPPVRAACELLGIDPLYIANEGKFVAVVPATQSDIALGALRAHPLGRDAAIIGEVMDAHPGRVSMHTPFGGSRIIDMLTGDPLPRIC